MAKAAHGEPVAWKLARPVRREGRRNQPSQGGQALCSYSTFSMFRAAPIAASMAVEETGNDRRASPRGPRCACAMGWACRDRNEMEDGGTGLSCFARNDGAAGRGRKFRSAVATSRARRSRLPVRHAKSRPRWASSVRDDGKRNRP